MNKTYLKTYVWLLAYLICTLNLSSLTAVSVVSSVSTPTPATKPDTEKPVTDHIDDIAVILVTNNETIKDKIIALYEKIKQVIQDFRNRPAQDPTKLKKSIETEILKLLVQGKITAKDIRDLKSHEVLLGKLSDRSSIILVQSIGNLSQAHQQVDQEVNQAGNLGDTTKSVSSVSKANQPVGLPIVAQEIVVHLSQVLAEISKIIAHENKTLVDKVSTHIGHLRSEFECAFQKSLMQCFTAQELHELRNFVKSPAFKKLLTNVPLMKEIFFKNLSPDIISKLKSLI